MKIQWSLPSRRVPFKASSEKVKGGHFVSSYYTWSSCSCNLKFFFDIDHEKSLGRRVKRLAWNKLGRREPSHKSCQNVWPNVGKEKNPEKGENVPNDWSRAMLLSSHPTHSLLFLGPLSIVVVVCHGSRASAQRTGVAMPQHVIRQTMHVEHMATHGGFRPHHRLQADGTGFCRLENGRRSVVGVHRFQQRLTNAIHRSRDWGP
ncbi:hypothetical protein NPIL_187901 [Nephila pilipes]|uniref:Uncharacterized protein n=1 Tax=Nephila pilipes TaxID=299642 RepID=A0A8X6UL95_NEPPI|nr:hypothetical protein NPIL_187901 [Nephila pilipes]